MSGGIFSLKHVSQMIAFQLWYIMSI